MSSEFKKGVKKLVSVLVTSTSVNITREKVVKIAKTVGNTGANENGKDDEYPETNFT